MMKLYIVGFIGLFLIGTTLQGSHASLIPDLLETVESLLGLGSECSQTPQALPFKGGILTDDGEYIQGSPAAVWSTVMNKMSGFLGAPVRFLFGSTLNLPVFNELDKHISNGDILGCADVAHKYALLSGLLEPLFDIYRTTPHTKVTNDLLEFEQILRADSKANATFPLKKIHQFHQTLANRFYDKFAFQLTSIFPGSC